MARDLTQTARALGEIPIAEMIKATAMGVIEAQFELERTTIALILQMGDPERGIQLGGQQRSLLELGFCPSLYHFEKAVISMTIDITVREAEEFSISGTVDLNVPLPDLAGKAAQ
jgi:hypothetical protein